LGKLWTDEAWEEYLYWQTQDKKTLKKLNNLIKDIQRHPFAEELIPEAYREGNDHIATAGIILGFALMMALDVGLG
jgi:hypothetical protein